MLSKSRDFSILANRKASTTIIYAHKNHSIETDSKVSAIPLSLSLALFISVKLSLVLIQRDHNPCVTSSPLDTRRERRTLNSGTH